MRRARWGSIGIALAVVCAGPATAQETKAKPERRAEHRLLERMVGHWDFSGKVYTEDSGSEPMKLEGSVDNRFLGESTWVVGTGKGRAGNDPYEVVGIKCFDAEKGKFVATGANSAFPPKLVLDEGTYDEASKTISWKEHEILEPGSGNKMTVKGEDTFKDDATFVSIVYIKRPGSNQFVKWVEITMKKRERP